MKWGFLMLIVICARDLLGQTIVIKDSLTNGYIENASIRNNNTGITSDQAGIVDISLFNNDEIIEISHVSYYTKKIRKKNIETIVYLTQKTNLLPEVTLTEPIKTSLSEKYPVFTILPLKGIVLETSTGDLLASKSSITVQESQPGGGSPNYRGMEASRLLLIVDGIALNNAIYRSGHLQSSATINPFFIESINLLSGPASVAYGNGAMGGALIFNTHTPKTKRSVHLNQKFESSSTSVITDFQANYYKKNLSHITAFSVKSANNLSMGENRFHGYNNWGKEFTNQNKQLYTNYIKADFLHKSKYKINNKTAILTNTQYSTSSKIYRFDKMNDKNVDGSNKYENWYYGPQDRFFQCINYASINKNFMTDNIKASLSFQDIKESRHVKIAGENLLSNRHETVNIYDFNIDLSKQFHKMALDYGIGARFEEVSSNANLSNSNSTFYNTTRYPDDGSSVKSFFTYSQINFPINKRLDILMGGRWNKSELLAKYKNTTFDFSNVKNNNVSFVKSALISFNATKNTTINFAFYSGFRNPNIDDLGKIFSKDNIHVIIPNPNLEPEYANNSELSISYTPGQFKIQIQIFNTQISNAIKREYGTFNGADSMLYDGQMMRVQMNKNIECAYINGIDLVANFSVNNNLYITATCNYLKGETYDKRPLSHIPPFSSKISFNYQLKQSMFNFYTHYNDWKLRENYDDSGVDNLDEATIEGNPSWYTLNLEYQKSIDGNITLSLGVKNILNAHYKTFGSGISASGRNFIIGLQTAF